MTTKSSNSQRDPVELEQAITDLERDYRREGYAVIARPSREQLPAFARDFGVELLAIRGEEHVLVRVKYDRANLRADPTISDQADLTNAQAGWRYDLVVVNGTNPLERDLRDAREPSDDQIGQMLTEAESVHRAGATRAGFLLAWAGLEATLRRTAQRGGVGGEIGTTAPLLVREVYASGYIREEDFRRLDQGSRLRSAVSHGFEPPAVDPADVEYMIGLARRLLVEPTQNGNHDAA